MVCRADTAQRVAQACLNRQANCVTCTMLFLALAKQSRLEAYPQETEETLEWQQYDGIVYRSNHVNAGVRLVTRTYTLVLGVGPAMARHPPQRISGQRLLAQYYNNHAATLMAEQRMPAALAYAQAARRLNPTYPITWSNTGVLRLHGGDPAGARRHYGTALTLEPKHAAALCNLVALYQRSGEPALEQRYRRRLDNVQRADPFHQFLVAVDYERHGNASLAIRHYQRAIRLQRSEHLFHYGLARAYELVGNSRRAMGAIERALALAPDAAKRHFYQQRIAQLSAQLSP